MVVTNLTTPANFFHLIRRQLAWNFRKPCFVLSPKSLLRHPKVFSNISEFTNSTFEEVIDVCKNKSKVKKVIFCTGKFFYDLDEYKEKNKIESIIIISSLYGKFGRQGRSLYTSSKHLLNGLVKNLCIDLSGQEIKVNSITPGFINTKMTKKNLSKKEIISISTKTPTGRLGTPKEVSNVIKCLILV